MGGIDEDWLALGEEQALEPELPIIDPHHHLWNYPTNRYLLGELEADAARHNVVKTVFVECGSEYRTDGKKALAPVGETEFVEAIAEQSASSTIPMQAGAGIVAHADLMLGPGVDEVLAAHREASPRLRGIRHSAAWHESDAIRPSHSAPPPHMLTLAPFREGFAQLARHGLSFDAWLFHTQIDELTDLAKTFDDTSIVLDHVGGVLGIGPFAAKREEVFAHWQKSIDAIAECPNVVVKLGGLQMAICGFGFHKQPEPPSSAQLAKLLGPYYLHCLERFGPERCMFESNFPVDKVSCSYTTLWNCFKRLAADLSQQEKASLFHDTAARVYRLNS